MKLDSEQKRVLKAGLPASLGAVLGTIVGMLKTTILPRNRRVCHSSARTGPSAGPIQAKTPPKCSYRSMSGTGTSTETFADARFQTLSIIRAAAS